jgi:hypothetical protein
LLDWCSETDPPRSTRALAAQIADGRLRWWQSEPSPQSWQPMSSPTTTQRVSVVAHDAPVEQTTVTVKTFPIQPKADDVREIETYDAPRPNNPETALLRLARFVEDALKSRPYDPEARDLRLALEILWDVVRGRAA